MSDQDSKKSDEEKRKHIYAKGYQADWAGGRSWAGQDGQHELEERKVKALESIAESLEELASCVQWWEKTLGAGKVARFMTEGMD